jgi:uncharacterized membrane protein YccC
MKIHTVEAKLINADIWGNWQTLRHDKANRRFLRLCKIYLKFTQTGRQRERDRHTHTHTYTCVVHAHMRTHTKQGGQTCTTCNISLIMHLLTLLIANWDK